jgi:hypothetical protein
MANGWQQFTSEIVSMARQGSKYLADFALNAFQHTSVQPEPGAPLTPTAAEVTQDRGRVQGFAAMNDNEVPVQQASATVQQVEATQVQPQAVDVQQNTPKQSLLDRNIAEAGRLADMQKHQGPQKQRQMEI